jgi:hypothetical protein
MAIYFFHLRDHGSVLLDEEGRELDGQEAVEAAALAEARAIIGAEARTGTINLDQVIEVEDQAGTVIHRLEFKDAVTIKR